MWSSNEKETPGSHSSRAGEEEVFSKFVLKPLLMICTVLEESMETPRFGDGLDTGAWVFFL